MMRRTLLQWLIATACTKMAAFADYDASEQPHIVFVLADDMGMGDIGYNKDIATSGYIPTDILDGLAEDGIKLGRFYANNLCTPARTSVLTGRFASRTNMKSPLDTAGEVVALNSDEQLLPEILKDLGYQAHMVGKWHLGEHERQYTPVGRGFDTFCGTMAGNADYFYHAARPTSDFAPHDFGCSWKASGNSSNPVTCNLVPDDGYYDDEDTSNHRYDLDFSQPSSESTTPDEATYGEYYMTNLYGDKAVEIIEGYNSTDGPLFLYVAFTAPHTPQQALTEDVVNCASDITGITDDDRQIFCGMTLSMDTNVGYIVDALEEQGMWDNTLFVFASDNGGGLDTGADNGGYGGSKASFYEGGLRTPAFMHFGTDTVESPSDTQGLINTQAIHLVDLFRTMVAAGEVDGKSASFDNDIDGRNLWPYLSTGANISSNNSDVNFNFAAGPGFASYVSSSNENDDGSYVEAVMMTYGDADYKLCRNCIGYTYDELYDVTNDPYETTNLYDSTAYAEVYALLDEAISDWADVSYPVEDNPTAIDTVADLLAGASIDVSLTDTLLYDMKCNLPYDSPEFLCTNCSSMLQSFPDTVVSR